MGTLKVSGALSAEAITRQIRDVELGGFSFVGCTVKGDWNNVHFAFSKRPAPLHVTLRKDVPPAKAVIIWTGLIRIAGKDVEASVFRELGGPEEFEDEWSVAKKSISDFDAISTPTLSRETVVQRALSGVGTDTVYSIQNPQSPSRELERWPAEGIRTDCSGFVAWCLRMPRKIQHPLYQKVNGGWFETTAIHRDGLETSGFFSVAPKIEPGCLVVYPDLDGNEGHIGIVVAGEGTDLSGVTEVVHCSSGNYRKHQKAILKTGAEAWKRRADSLILVYAGYT